MPTEMDGRLKLALTTFCSGIAMSGRTVDVQSNMRCHTDSPERANHSFGVVVLVGPPAAC